jgi:hypothetical protein
MWLRFKSLRPFSGAVFLGLLGIVLVTVPMSAGTIGQNCINFVRGDNDNNLVVDANDVVDHLGYVLSGGTGGVPICLPSADSNDNGIVSIADTLATMRSIILETALPLPSCVPGVIPCVPGPDPTPGVVTVPDDADSRFEFSIGDAVGFPQEQGVHVPMTLSSTVPYYGFQAAFEFDALQVQVSNIFFEDTVIEGNDYVFAHSQNDAVGAFSVVATLVDVFTPFSGESLPAGQNQLVADIVFTVSSAATPGANPIDFVDGRKIPDHPDPTILPAIENLVILEDEEFRPFLNGGVFTVTAGFVRGDANFDGGVDISDPIFTLLYILFGGLAPPCEQGADTNNDDGIDISDAIFTLQYLFLGAAEPSEPFPNKGPAIPGRELTCSP